MSVWTRKPLQKNKIRKSTGQAKGCLASSEANRIPEVNEIPTRPLDRWTAGPLDRWTAGLLDCWTGQRWAAGANRWAGLPGWLTGTGIGQSGGVFRRQPWGVIRRGWKQPRCRFKLGLEAGGEASERDMMDGWPEALFRKAEKQKSRRPGGPESVIEQ